MEQGCRRLHANDVEVVCEAIKWHAILIANDGDSKPKTANGRPHIARKNRNLNIAAERPVA